MGVRGTERLMERLFVLGRPCARFQVLNDEEEKVFVGRAESAIYTFKASTTRNHDESFHLVQDVASSFIGALLCFFKELSGGHLQCHTLFYTVHYESKE